MSLIMITPPTAVPISLPEAKAQARYYEPDEDALFVGYVRAATAHIEQTTGLRLITGAWEYSIDHFPERHCRYIRLPLAPLFSLTSVTYLDAQGMAQTLPIDTYLIRGLGSTQPAQIVLAPTQTWPSTWPGIGSVLLRTEFGFGPDHNYVPEDLRQAVQMLACHWFENRSATAAGPDYGPVGRVPYGVAEIIEPYRLWPV
jgi:uncharacterized phiE125 gp8 family phage protein